MKIKFDSVQIKLLEKLNLDFDIHNDLSDDNIEELDNKVSDYFSFNCINSDDVTEEGLICESIIDKLDETCSDDHEQNNHN